MTSGATTSSRLFRFTVRDSKMARTRRASSSTPDAEAIWRARVRNDAIWKPATQPRISA